MNEVQIYTDGACKGNPGPGGWGAWLKSGATEKELFGGELNTTNNRMELQAVIEGLGALKRPCKVILYLDSQYVRMGITEWIRAPDDPGDNGGSPPPGPGSTPQTSTPPPPPLRSVHTSNFPVLLTKLGISVLVTTYQAGKLIVPAVGTCRIQEFAEFLEGVIGVAQLVGAQAFLGPIQERDVLAADHDVRKEVQSAVGVTFGDAGNMYVFACRTCKARPIRSFMRCS